MLEPVRKSIPASSPRRSTKPKKKEKTLKNMKASRGYNEGKKSIFDTTLTINKPNQKQSTYVPKRTPGSTTNRSRPKKSFKPPTFVNDEPEEISFLRNAQSFKIQPPVTISRNMSRNDMRAQREGPGYYSPERADSLTKVRTTDIDFSK